MTDAAEPLARAEAAGIHCLAIPTPFAVGAVNLYLIDDDPLTLIDAGPNSGVALDELEQGLDAVGRRIEEIGLLVLTHQHMDHIGLAAIIARRSGADVGALDQLAPYLERFGEDMELDDRFAARQLLRHGIPEDVVHALRAVSASYRAWGSSVRVNRPLTPGTTLELRDRRLEILHRPGHSPSDTVFWDADRRILIGGDHLIGHISSNPLLTRPLGDRGEEDAASPRPQALVSYISSLEATRQMDIDFILAGHGVPVEGHAGLIDERLRLHERRAQKIYDLVAERPRTAYEIAQALWGTVAVTQAYLTLSEVLGHADLLLNRGRIVETVRDGTATFEVAGA
ncbi:MAG TPA: MBL fold metallo-hydrolase [Solirubrobacteraceae bacterium]|nr:MBL fold metallo-hydrolase [Solirubrobacteraceae bacterium]